MSAEGIDPAAATEEQWRAAGAKVANEMLAETAPAAPSEPASDWWGVAANLLGIAGSYFGVKGGILGAQAIAGVLAGRQTRATENIGTAISPTSSWQDTLKAIAALALDTHSPKSAPTAPSAPTT
ncbi:MAG TPA: hypothetical protein VFD43_00285 [Planctomycetota bacterium]|nr:hypothetical protein [Planctomycetota bacterium]